MKKSLLSILFIGLMISNIFSLAFSADSATQTISATLTRPPVPPVPPGGGGTGAGVAVGVGAGAAAAAGGAAAFAPLLLAGLSPNSVIAAAAPIGCIACRDCYLQKAIMNHFGTQDINQANAMMASGNCKTYFAQNDSRILNGTFDMQGITLPANLYTAKQVRVNVTLFSDPYSAVKGDPFMSMALYKDISQANLRKKFETQQFRRAYLMKKYDIPLTKHFIAYDQGIQKLTGIINVGDIKYKDIPMQVAMTYTEGGFQKNQAVENPKVKTYAYLLEFEMIK